MRAAGGPDKPAMQSLYAPPAPQPDPAKAAAAPKAKPASVDSYNGKSVIGKLYQELPHDCNPFEVCPVCAPALATSGWQAAHEDVARLLVGLRVAQGELLLDVVCQLLLVRKTLPQSGCPLIDVCQEFILKLLDPVDRHVVEVPLGAGVDDHDFLLDGQAIVLEDYLSVRPHRREEVVSALDVHLEQPLREVMFADAGSELGALLDQTAYTQPALFALEVALCRLWEAWGVKSSVLAGHSIGELSAAHVAGVLSLADAAKLVCARGRLMQACHAGGAMVSLEASEGEVRAALSATQGVDIAGLNGPRQVVISGDAEAVLALAEQFAAQGRRTRRLTVSHAFHSAHMDGMLSEFGAVARTCHYTKPNLPVVSMMTGQRVGESDPAIGDEVVLLGAHLDSWHTATGATDNADGSATMLRDTGWPMGG